MKPKLILLTILLLTGSVGLFAQQTAQLTRFERLPITGVNASDGFSVELRQGEQTGVQIEIDEELLPKLICRLDGGILRIGLSKLSVHSVRDIFNQRKVLRLKAIVTLSRLDYLSLSDMACASSAGTLTAAGSGEITVSDMSKVNRLELQAERISVRCSDMSKISESTLRGTQSVSLKVSDMSTASDVEVYAPTLDVSCSDMSKVSVGGEVNSLGAISCHDMSSFNQSRLTVKNKQP